MKDKTKRVIKVQIPISTWVKSILIGVGAFAFIVFAIWQTGKPIVDAKMTGTVVSKEFKPLAQTERQITLNRDGAVRTDNVDGEYIITVEVLLKDGSKKTFTVWLNDQKRFESTNVGDTFDVGPYLVKE
jgi:lipopolysaccharide export LptBFGC system permease protein LptF